MRRPLFHRLTEKFKIGDECWEWTGAKDRHGYGQIWQGIGDQRLVYAHRAVYEILVGPIPVGLVIDHLCRNPACVKPTHLEPVTQKDNVLRGFGFMADRARQTACIHGHPFDATNTGIRQDTGTRFCRACKKMSNDKSNAMRRVSA